MQRIGPIAELPALVKELGGDPQDVLAQCGLEPGDLKADGFIPVSVFVQLLECAAEATRRPDLALLLGLRPSPALFGPVGQLMTFAPTLGHALSDFVRFQIDNSGGAAVYLHRMGEDVALGIGIYDPLHRASPLPYDLAVASGFSIIRHLTQGSVQPSEVLLIRREPDNAAPYLQLARCPVRFDQPQCCIILSARNMNHPLKTADPDRHAGLLKLLNERLSQRPWGIAGQVRHALRPLLLVGGDSLEDVARVVGIHHRTLERQLRQEGTSFEAIKDEMRFTMAKDLLALTGLRVGEISASLGYGSHSSLGHAFRRWTGTTPSAWRKAFLDPSRSGASREA